MRFRYLIFAGLIATAVTGCPRKKDNTTLKKDLDSIDTYLKEKEITASSTSSGLRYKILQAGTGEKPKVGDTVTLSCTRQILEKDEFGKYVASKPSSDYFTVKFESSIDKFKSGTFLAYLNTFLANLQEIVTLLGKGGKAQLFRPCYSLDDENPAGDNPIEKLEKLEIEITDISSLKKDLASIDTYLEQKGITKLSTSSGLRYSILQEGTDEKPKVGDIVTLSCRRRPLNGEIGNQAVDSETCDIKLGEDKDLKEVEDVITLVGKGGEAQLFIPSSWGAELLSSWGAERLFSLLENSELLSMLLDSDKQARGNLICEIKITDISSLKKDLASIDTYLEQKGITKLSTSSGLRYSILQKGTDEKPEKGDIVTLSCRRRPLNGEIGNQAVDSETCDIKLGKDKDLEEVEAVITLLGKGGEAQLFIPSSWGAELLSSWGAERFYSLLENSELLSMLLDSDKQARGNLICEIKITDISSPET